MDPFSTIKGAQIPAEQVKVFVGQTTQSKGHLVSTSQHIIKMKLMIMIMTIMMDDHDHVDHDDIDYHDIRISG